MPLAFILGGSRGFVSGIIRFFGPRCQNGNYRATPSVPVHFDKASPLKIGQQSTRGSGGDIEVAQHPLG